MVILKIIQNITNSLLGICKVLLVLFLFILNLTAQAQIQEIRRIEKNLFNIKSEKGKIDAWNTLASLFTQNKRDSVLYYADLAETHATKINYDLGVAKALNSKGSYYKSLNNYLAAQYFNQALQLSKKANDPSVIAESMNNVGASLYLDQKYPPAMKYFYDADKLAHDNKVDSIRSLILLNIAGLDTSLSSKSRDSITRLAIQIAVKYKDEIKLLQQADVEARSHYNPFSDLVSFLGKSIAKADSMGNTTMKIHFLRRLAEGYILNNDGVNGVKKYQEALQLSRKNSYQFMTTHILNELFKYYRKTGNMERSGFYADQLMQENQLINDAVKKSGFAYVDYAMSQNNLKIEQEKAMAQKKVIIGFSILTVLILLLLFFVYRSYHIKKNFAIVQQELHEQSKEREADLADREKFYNTIISIMAHDLRTPFSSLIMASDLYQSGSDVLSDQDKGIIMTQMKSISIMSIQFMDGLLAWVKSRMDGYIYKAKPYHLSEIITEANNFCRNDQDAKGIKFIVDLTETKELNGDKNMLLFVFRNVLSNATKYSNKGSEIIVKSRITESHTILSIKDSGLGMSEQAIQNLFSYKEETDLSTGKVKGAGIALTICYEMVIKMNGKIWAESILGEGTTFHISLPNNEV